MRAGNTTEPPLAAQRGCPGFSHPVKGFELETEPRDISAFVEASRPGPADIAVFKILACIPFRNLLLILKLIITLNFNKTDKDRTSMQSTNASHESRCLCGNLLARLRPDGVELKCRRCKRIVVIPWKESVTPPAVLEAMLPCNEEESYP